mgnify:CR=1 FL=1
MSQLEVIQNTIEAAPKVTLFGEQIKDLSEHPYKVLHELPVLQNGQLVVCTHKLAVVPVEDLDEWDVDTLEDLFTIATNNDLETTERTAFTKATGDWISRGRATYREVVGSLSLSATILESEQEDYAEQLRRVETDLARTHELIRKIIVTLYPRREYAQDLVERGFEGQLPLTVDQTRRN